MDDITKELITSLLSDLYHRKIIDLPKVSSRYRNSIFKALKGDRTDLIQDYAVFSPYLDSLCAIKNNAQAAKKWKQKQIEHLVNVAKILSYYINITSFFGDSNNGKT